MKVIVNFGLVIKKEVDWYKDISDFPRLLRFNGQKWEWVVYNSIGNGYQLTFSQLPTYDPNFYADMNSFEDMFERYQDRCECGAAYSKSFSFDHMRFCKKWKPWSQI